MQLSYMTKQFTKIKQQQMQFGQIQKFIWSLNLNSYSNQLQLTCCNLNIEHNSTMPCYVLHLDCALQCDVYIVVVSAFSSSRQIHRRTQFLCSPKSGTPSLDNKASKPPLIISIKTQFPSCSLMHEQVFHMLPFSRQLNPSFA